MISNFVEGDQHLIDMYDEMSLALAFSIDPDIVAGWSEVKIAWAKTTLKIKNEVEGGK